MTRMSDERLVQMDWILEQNEYSPVVHELLAALKAERQEREEWKGLAERSQEQQEVLIEERNAERQRVAELESLRNQTIKIWHEEQTRRQAAEARVEAAKRLAKYSWSVMGMVTAYYEPGWVRVDDLLEALGK